MKKSQLGSVIVVTALLVSLLSVCLLDNTVSATNTPPSVDATIGSHKLQHVQASGSASLSITTSTEQEIIYATFFSQNTGYGLSISSTPALTWHYRGGGNTTSSNGEIAVWWAVSNIAQTVQITFTSSQNTKKDYVMSAFCVMNADTASPFDPNVSSASFNHDNTASASASITTTNPNDLVIGVLGIVTNRAITFGNGYQLIDSVSIVSGLSGADESLAVTPAGTYAPTFTFEKAVWVEIADAFVPTSESLSVLPEYSFGGITGFVVTLAAMLVFFNRKRTAQKLEK